jgi:hypothetical protein
MAKAYMNEETSKKVVETARLYGFIAVTKPGLKDRYEKNILLHHQKTGNYVYVRKDRFLDSTGGASRFAVAIHPKRFVSQYSSPEQGFEQAVNTRTGSFEFLSSNFREFPKGQGKDTHVAYMIHTDGFDSLGRLFATMAGMSSAQEIPPKVAEPAIEVSRSRGDSTAKIGRARPGFKGFNELSGLVIRSEPLAKILRGEKIWEMRSRSVHKRGAIALIEKGTGLVKGIAELVDCVGPLTDQQMIENQDKHGIHNDRLHDAEIAKWRIAWVLSNVQTLANPVRYVHPSGAVTWVNLDANVIANVRQQLRLD